MMNKNFSKNYKENLRRQEKSFWLQLGSNGSKRGLMIVIMYILPIAEKKDVLPMLARLEGGKS